MSAKKIEIKVYIDDSCDMAKVFVNKKCIMEGNFWDFHPGCHGINEYGDFNTYAELTQKLFLFHRKKDPEAKIEISRHTYKYDA